jgi:hypothetical protein
MGVTVQSPPARALRARRRPQEETLRTGGESPIATTRRLATREALATNATTNGQSSSTAETAEIAARTRSSACAG